ncbi:MAG: branched-chain amino acid aminotransferase [Flavobacteriales bacterium]|nr:branched-chain amino acid aminotransferase [Flavobacteriales bacterium]
MSETKAIRITRAKESKLKGQNLAELKFGSQFTDHMFVADYVNGAWQVPDILPYENISLDPATSFIHYGQSIFEGLKAHKSENGDTFLFRPKSNWMRMNHSAERLCMQPIPEELFMEGMLQLLNVDRDWIPSGDSSSIYVRPFMFGTEAFLGVRPSSSYRFMVILSPSGSYYAKPVKVKIETEYARAMTGGVGSAKTSGNYAASLFPASLGQKKGFDQLIWTDAKNHEKIEESGTMNVMFVVDGKLITPKLSSSILAGITRDSVITIAREKGIAVEQRDVFVSEIISAIKSGTLTEAFGVGTAATIAHIESIGYQGDILELNPIANRTISPFIEKYLNDYKRGRIEDKYGWLVKV